jgi:C_GCAxxG_C_C family probable redox protein
VQSRIDDAVQRFHDGMNCAQSVFTSYAPIFGVGEADALRIATAFGGGMGSLQEVCGAVTGAFMAIGACCGMRRNPDNDAKEKTSSLVRQLGTRFAGLHGSLTCRGLLGCDFSTQEGQAQFKEQKLRDSKCTAYVRDACRLLEELVPGEKG